MLRYSYHRLASGEFLDVVKWYRVKKQNPERAARFYAAVEQALAHIRAHPEAAQLEHPLGIRAFPVRRFEYSIHYLIVGGSIRILSIAHHKRRPFYWIRRLRNP